MKYNFNLLKVLEDTLKIFKVLGIISPKIKLQSKLVVITFLSIK